MPLSSEIKEYADKEEPLAGIAIGAGAVAAAIGLFHLLSWFARFVPFSRLSPEVSSCLFFAGTALAMASAAPYRNSLLWPCRILAVLTATIAPLSFLLDPQRVHHPPRGHLPSWPAGHGMGGTDAVGLTLAGIAILLSLRLRPPMRRVQSMAIIVSLVSIAAILGRLYQVDAVTPSGLIRSALPTTIATLLIGIGLLFARPREALMAPFTAATPGGTVARLLVIPAVALPVLLGWLRLQGELHGLYGLVTGTSLLVLSWIAILLALAHQVAIRFDAERIASEEHMAREALRESEEQFRAVFQQAAVGMGRVNFSDARWMQVNDAFCRMLGYTEEEMRSTPWPEMTHPEDLDLDLIPFREMAAGRLENYTVDKRFFHSQGHIVWARLTLSLVRDAHGQPDYEIAIVEDISERKEAEEALRKAKSELEQRVRERTAQLRRAYEDLQRETEKRLSAVEDLRTKEQLLLQQSRLAAMGEMLGNIAHQWRQPLNVLALLVQQLELSYQAGQFTGEMLKAEVAKALKLIKHMSQTIDDFKDFLKEEKENRVFSVNNAVVTTISLLEPELKKMNIELSIDEAAEVLITGHRNEFSHVVMNLITNARDAFAERGTAAPRIAIGIFKDEGKSVVTVADNAGGIPEEFRDRIFEPYFTTKAPDKGTGIGLFMSKSIIEKSMGGRLSVRNLPEGAEFRIEL